MKSKQYNYVAGIVRGLGSLLTGMRVTFVEFFTPKTTEQYPENRHRLVIADRFRGTLVMPHDEQGHNRCIACGLCQAACPNDTISLEIGAETDAETGKKKKILLRYQYDLGSCMFCQLCVNACPTGAIEFNTRFEHAVFDKGKLVKQLNQSSNKN